MGIKMGTEARLASSSAAEAAAHRDATETSSPAAAATARNANGGTAAKDAATARAAATAAATRPAKPAATSRHGKMASAFRSLGSWVFKSGSTGKASLDELFPRTDPATDGDDCLHDCESCTVRYPRNFKIEESDKLYGGASQWSTHLLVGTGKADWVRDVADEKGSVMQAVGKASGPSNGVSYPATARVHHWATA